MRSDRKKREQENKKKASALNIIAGLFVLSEIVFIIFTLLSGIIPVKYFAVLIVILLLLTLGVLRLILRTRNSSGKKKVGGALAIILIIILSIGSYYMFSTYNLFNNISGRDSQVEDFYAVALRDGSYDDKKDIEGQQVFVADGATGNYAQAQDKLKEEFGVSFTAAADYTSLMYKLIDANGASYDNIIFLSSSNYEMLCDDNPEFEKGTKILYTVSIAIEGSDIAKPVNVTKDTFNVYISGIDTFGSISTVARSDVNMLMTVNPTEKKILLTSIPRDMYVTLHSYGAKDKLTHTGIYGVDETIQTVEDWLGIDINYYVRVNFTTLEDIVDIIGGIDVESDVAFKSAVSSYSYVAGTNHLNGEGALYFARERKAFPSGDNQRVKNQQKVLSAIINKLTSSKTLLLKYPQLLGALKNQVQTNMTEKEIASLVKMQLNDMSGWDIETISITGSGASAVTYSMPGQSLYVMVPNEESVAAAKQSIAALEG